MQKLKCLSVLMVVGLCLFTARTAASEMVFPHYTFKVSTTENSAIRLNAHTTLKVTLVPTSKDAPPVHQFSFDAKMPQHKHGMVTTPKVVKISDLEYRVEGVRLHMAGLWVFEFLAQHPSGETKISSGFDLKTK
jgi:hypothetical protein